MAGNVTSIQILVDGRENTVIKLQGVLDTADIGSTTVADPATLSDMGPFAGMKASQLRIKRIQYSIEDSLSVNLFWDATTPLLIEELTGRGQMDFTQFGGLQNNAGAGKNGKITYTTQGWAATAVVSFSLILELGKQ
jgi:hypothetical protein